MSVCAWYFLVLVLGAPCNNHPDRAQLMGPYTTQQMCVHARDHSFPLRYESKPQWSDNCRPDNPCCWPYDEYYLLDDCSTFAGCGKKR